MFEENRKDEKYAILQIKPGKTKDELQKILQLFNILISTNR